MPPTITPPTEFAKRMRDARMAAGLRLDEASVDARRVLGTDWGPSRETIRRYESGLISEDRADPLVVTALAEIYGVSVGQLSWKVAQQTDFILNLVRKHRRREGFEALKEETEKEESRTH